MLNSSPQYEALPQRSQPETGLMSKSATFGLSAAPRNHTSVMEHTPRAPSTDAACCETSRRMEVVRHGQQKLTQAALASPRFDGMIGSSAALTRVLEKISRVAPTEATVLITGESGTGKELTARAIHARSNRAGRPFIRVNCAAIPPSLIASELFGYERGAFTGAAQRHMGRFERADHGTIFLDEIGDIPAETQVALLRVLQEREFERVGGTRPVLIDVRVLAATNCDLQAAVASGQFRADLYYRLHVFPIHMPALRDRMDDIPSLVEHLIACCAAKIGKNVRCIDDDSLERLVTYDWPGNIRELQNVLERAVILCEGETARIEKEWLDSGEAAPSSESIGLSSLLMSRERELIEAALEESMGRVAGPNGAAGLLGIPRTTLESRIKSLQIDKFRYKSSADCLAVASK
jgi:formate hydrogenlyase transcriptional activator